MKQLAFIILLFLPTLACAGTLYPESSYQAAWCNKKDGIAEYRLPEATRVDCLLDEFAVEFDFAHKWAKSIGQALYYSSVTGRRPAVVMIIEDLDRDFKYLIRLLTAIQEDAERWRVWVMMPGMLEPTVHHIAGE
jgi:hypothetical protein